jgi:hypothetical protein
MDLFENFIEQEDLFEIIEIIPEHRFFTVKAKTVHDLVMPHRNKK